MNPALASLLRKLVVLCVIGMTTVSADCGGLVAEPTSKVEL